MLTAKDLLKKYSIQIVIISRGRSEFIGKKTCRIFPDYVPVLVPDNQVEDYKKEIKNPIHSVPAKVKGLGNLRNWILQNYDAETVIMVDDDINHMYCLTGELSKRIEDPDHVVQVLINTAIMAKDAETNVFSFNQTDIRKYKATDPFNLNTWGGCVVGVIGREFEFIDNKLKVDVDFFLQNLLVNRIDWVDSRYYFHQSRDCNVGGNAAYRNEKTFHEEIDRLKAKWGKYFNIAWHGNQAKTTIRVTRKQSGLVI